MANDFQRRKIAGVFNSMDVNGDGFLEEADFAALTARWTDVRGWAPGTPGHTRLTEIMMGWWSALLAGSDLNRDNKVTLDEVMSLVDQLPAMTDYVTGTATAMFEAVDENGDGEISAAEYHQLIVAWSGTDTNTDEVFPLLDRNGDGHLSQAEFVELWTEFWAGDDPSSPGSWLFGRFELPMLSGR